MKIAVCFSGQVRSGSSTAESFLRYLGPLRQCSDFFIHTWDEETISFQDDTVPVERRGARFPLDFSKLGKIIELYRPKALELDSLDPVLTRENSKGYVEPFNPMFYSLWRANELKKESEIAWDNKYDYVIRSRFDLDFAMGLSLAADLDRHQGLSIIDPMKVINNALEDQFWIASSSIMDELATFYFTRAKSNNARLSWQIHMKNYVDAALGVPITILPDGIRIQR